MTINPDGAFSRGDTMRRLAELEDQVRELQTARRLEAAKVGRGGLRVLGGLFRAQDSEGDDMFRVGGDPGELFLREDLLAPFARAIFANALSADEGVLAGDIDSTPGSDWRDLGAVVSTVPPPGPTVSVDVSVGLILMGLSADLSISELGTSNVATAEMSAVIDGPSRAPAWPSTLRAVIWSAGAEHDIQGVSYGRTFVVRGGSLLAPEPLAPGTYTIQAKYDCGGENATAQFAARTLWAIGL